MKNIFFFLLLIFTISAGAQSGVTIPEERVISRETTIFLQDTTWKKREVVLLENGTESPDSVIFNTEIGDSLALVQAALSATEADANYMGIARKRILEIPQKKQVYNAWNTAIQTVTAGAFNLANLKNFLYAPFYGVTAAGDPPAGVYRINLPGQTDPIWTRAIITNGGGVRFRVTDGRGGPDVSPQVQYTVNILWQNEFEITYGGGTYTVTLSGQSAPGRLHFLPPLRFQKGGAVPFNSIVRVQ